MEMEVDALKDDVQKQVVGRLEAGAVHIRQCKTHEGKQIHQCIRHLCA